MTDLFSPLKLGDYMLPNRIIMAPLTRARSLPGAIPNWQLKREYYSQRASAGLIIAEATAVSPMGIGWLNTCGIWNYEQQSAWQHVTQAVRNKGGRMFVQLWHMGSVVTPDFIDGKQPVSASAVKLQGELRTPKGRKQSTVVPRALTLHEIEQEQQNFVEAARRSIAAGFQGVEIHAANGFLLEQFIRDSTNQRQDEYGGTIENRLRFTLEIVKKTCQAIGPGKVGIRISPTTRIWGIQDSEYRRTFSTLVEALNDFDLAYLHMLEPRPDSGHELQTYDYMTPELAKLYRGNFIVNGGYSKASGTAAIADGNGTAVSYGYPFIANPDLVDRFLTDAPLSEADPATFYSNEAEGYIDYPLSNTRQQAA